MGGGLVLVVMTLFIASSLACGESGDARQRSMVSLTESVAELRAGQALLQESIKELMAQLPADRDQDLYQCYTGAFHRPDPFAPGASVVGFLVTCARDWFVSGVKQGDVRVFMDQEEMQFWDMTNGEVVVFVRQPSPGQSRLQSDSAYGTLPQLTTGPRPRLAPHWNRATIRARTRLDTLASFHLASKGDSYNLCLSNHVIRLCA